MSLASKQIRVSDGGHRPVSRPHRCASAVKSRARLFAEHLTSIVVLCSALVCGAAFAQAPALVVQTGHVFQIFTVAYSPDGKLIASGSEDRKIIIWDAATGRQLRSMSLPKYTRVGVQSVAFSPDGKSIASGNAPHPIVIWDVASGRDQYLKGGSSSVVFSPDGRLLISGGNSGPVLWDVVSGENKAYGVSTSTSFPSPKINSVAISADGSTIVAGGTEFKIELWDAATGALKKRINHPDEVQRVAITPDAKFVISKAAGIIYLWDAATGTRLWKTTEAFGTMALSPDGRFIAAGADKNIRILDVATRNVIRTFTVDESPVMTMAFSPDGKRLVAGHGRGEVTQWEIDTGSKIMTMRSHSDSANRITVSPDSNRIVMTGWNENTIRMLDASANTMMTLRGHTRVIDSVCFSPDGRVIATGASDDTIKVWDAGTGVLLRTIRAEDVAGIGFSPDSRTLAFFAEEWVEKTREDIRSIRQVNLETGAELSRWEVWGMVRAIAYSPDGKRIAASSSNDVVLYDAITGNKSLELKVNHSATVRRVAFSADGKMLASYDESGNITVWDATTGSELHVLKEDDPATPAKVFETVPAIYQNAQTGNAGPVIPNGKIQVISGTEAGVVELREFETKKVLGTIIVIDENDWLVTSPEGYFDGTPAAWKQLIWRFNNNTLDYAPVEAYFNDFFHPSLLQDILNGRSPKPKPGRELTNIDRRQPRVAVSSTSASAGGRMVNVTIAVADNRDKPLEPDVPATSGAQDVRLFRNGSLVKVWRGDVLKGKESVVLETPVPVVAGENNLTAYAFNSQNVKSQDAMLTLKGAENLKRKGVAYVLSVGVNEYANSQYDLKYAVPDATEFAGEVKRQQDKLANFERVEIAAFSNQEATKANILKALSDISAKIQPEDLLTIYFAGHGTAKQNRFYLIPHDLGYMGPRDKLDDLSLKTILEHSISDEELEAAVEKIDASQMLLVIDACNSGQALEAEEKRRGPMNSKGLAQLAYEKGMFILAAAQSQQAALEVSRLGHGLLTYALLQGLQKAERNAKGEIIERKWLDYAVRSVPDLQLDEMRKRDAQIKQDPTKRDAEIIFVNGDNKKLPPEKRGLQTPRVFYRREFDSSPLVVAKP